MECFAELVDKYQKEGWLIRDADISFGCVLGRGASGTTYNGTFQGERVAIKAYSTSILTNDSLSVKNEMDIMSKLNHPNVVQFKGLCLSTDPVAAALVTAYASKGELGDALYRTRIVRRKGDPLRFKIVLGMARGLKYLHEHHIVHRDIKPANVLLDDNYEPMLTDFGFSRFIDNLGDMTGETGSYRYMAPEVTRHGRYSGKADVFSFAMVCNEIFSDERPYQYLIAIEAAVGVVKRNLRPSQKRIKNQRLKAIIARSWDPEPEKRPEWDEIISQLTLAQAEMERNKSGIGALFRKKTSSTGSSGDSTRSS